MSLSWNVESEEERMSERAMLLQQYISELKAKVEQEKRTLHTERDGSSEDLKGLGHFPTCPLSDLADIDPKCSVHGHLSSVEWKSLTSLRMRGPHTLLSEPIHDGRKNSVLEDGEWLDFDPNASSTSLHQVDNEGSMEFERDQLPVPPSETQLTSCQSYMSKLLEVDNLCKKEMSRVNAIAPNLDHLNQMASDWKVEAANFPDFSRLAPEDGMSVTTDSFLEDNEDENDKEDRDDDDSTSYNSDHLAKASSQLNTIEEFVKTLGL